MARTILVIDDEHNMRWVLDRALQKAGYEVLTAERGEKGLQLFARHPVDLVLLDLKMPGMDGLAVLRELRQRNSEIPILLLTAYATVPTAVEALQVGANDYIRKPFDLETVLAHINRHLALDSERTQAFALDQPIAGLDEFVGAAPALAEPMARAKTAVQSDYPVLIMGEPGTGRRHLARLLHECSPATSGRRLVTIDCANLPPAILNRELLGEVDDELGCSRWQQALGGSLLLSNAEALPESMLKPLVHHLTDYLRTPQRPHGLRLILTTNQKLPEAWSTIVDSSVTICLPPLRERPEDLALLINYFAPKIQWNREARAYLASYSWPGNVAELQRVVRQAAHLAGDEPVQVHHLPSHLAQFASASTGQFDLPPEGINLEEVEQNLIRQALSMARGNKTQASRLLGLSRATFLYRLDKYEIEAAE